MPATIYSLQRERERDYLQFTTKEREREIVDMSLQTKSVFVIMLFIIFSSYE